MSREHVIFNSLELSKNWEVNQVVFGKVEDNKELHAQIECPKWQTSLKLYSLLQWFMCVQTNEWSSIQFKTFEFIDLFSCLWCENSFKLVHFVYLVSCYMLHNTLWSLMACVTQGLLPQTIDILCFDKSCQPLDIEELLRTWKESRMKQQNLDYYNCFIANLNFYTVKLVSQISFSIQLLSYREQMHLLQPS